MLVFSLLHAAFLQHCSGQMLREASDVYPIEGGIIR